MENNNPANGKKLSAKAQKDIQKITEEEAQEAQWRSELLASEPVRQYLEQFEAASVDRFIDSYLFNKKMWVQYGDMYAQMKENEDLRFDNEAEEYLKLIQQKKLFELQCLWRAEKIKLPTVQLTYDFLLWQHDILNCPFIEPITEEDVALCKEYILQGTVDLEEDYGDLEWQDYDAIKAGYTDDTGEGYYPDWYEFVDSRKGSGSVLLPDIRGEKESFYRDLYFDSQKEIRAAQAVAQQEAMAKQKPSLSSYDDDAIEYLVKTFESKEIQYQYKAYKLSTDDSWEWEKIQEMINLLRSAEEPVPIEANEDWFKGLQQAVLTYKCKKIAEALPRVWEQYSINVQMGIAFPKERSYFEDAYRAIHQQILTGRKLNGEPEDLNF